MRLSNFKRLMMIAISFASIAMLASCMKATGDSTASTHVVAAYPTYDNAISISVNGSGCSAGSYLNKPCVSVTICAPGSTTNCQTVGDILLDTGSYGLRVFKSVLNNSLQAALPIITTSGGKTLAQCAQFGDGSADWGPVARADLVLGNEPSVQVPIQLIDSSFSSISQAACPTPEVSPAAAGLNGILGIGLFQYDCGSACTTIAGNGLYFACNATSCNGTTAPLNDQLQNPIAKFPVDNNGYILQFQSVPLGGAPSVTGQLIFGIGTRANNSASAGSLTIINTDGNGYFSTTFNGTSYSSFFDTGSNGYFFPNSGFAPLVGCTGGLVPFYCPTATLLLGATVFAHSGGNSKQTNFYIGDASQLSSSHDVFPEIGADIGGTVFDWGMPFHFGRTIYGTLGSKSSSLGNGPSWAY